MKPLIKLPDSVTVSEVAALREQWLTTLEGHPNNTLIDARDVVEVDGAGLQLLVALEKSFAAHGHALQLVAPSTTLTDAMNRMGWTLPITNPTAESVA